MSQAAQEHPSPDGLVGVLAKITPRASGGDTLEVPAQISTFLLQEDYLSRVAEVEFGEIELMKARWQQRSIAVTEQDDNPRGWVRAEIQYAYPGLSPEERVKIETLVWLVRNACPDKFTSSADQFQPLNMRRLSTTPVRGLVRMVIDRLEQFAKGGNVQQIVPVDRLEAEIVSLREKLAASEARREAAETGELEAEEEVRQAQALASELRRQMEEVIQAYQTLREQTKPGTMTGEDIARAIEEAQQRGIKTGEGKAEIQIYQLRTQIRELKAENARLAEEGAAAQGEVTKANRRLALEQQEAAVVAAELKFLKQRVAASDFVPKAEVDRLVQIALDGLRQQHLQQIAQLEEQLAEAGKRAAEAEAKAAKAEAALQESAQQRVSTKDAKVRPIGPERVDVEADMGQKKAAEASAWIAKHRKTLQILDQIRDYHGEWFYPDLIRADISSLQDVPSEVTNYLVLSLAWAQRQLNIEDNREMGELDPRILSDGDRVSIAQAAAETNNRPLPTIDSVDVACQGEIISSPKSDADAALEASMRELVSLAEVVATRPLPASIGDVRGINIVIRKNKIGIAQLMQALGITPTGDPQRFTKMVCMGTWPRVGPVAVAFNPDYSPKKAESPAQYLLDVAEVLARVLETGQPIVPLLSYGLAFNKQQFIDGLYTVEGQIGTPESSYSFLREFDSHSLSSEDRIAETFYLVSQFLESLRRASEPISAQVLGLQGQVYVLPHDVRAGNVTITRQQGKMSKLVYRDLNRWMVIPATEAGRQAIPAHLWSVSREFFFSLFQEGFMSGKSAEPIVSLNVDDNTLIIINESSTPPSLKKFVSLWNQRLAQLLKPKEMASMGINQYEIPSFTEDPENPTQVIISSPVDLIADALAQSGLLVRNDSEERELVDRLRQ